MYIYTTYRNAIASAAGLGPSEDTAYEWAHCCLPSNPKLMVLHQVKISHYLSSGGKKPH